MSSPSTFSAASNAPAVSGVTEPPYWRRIEAAALSPARCPISSRIIRHIVSASSVR